MSDYMDGLAESFNEKFFSSNIPPESVDNIKNVINSTIQSLTDITDSSIESLMNILNSTYADVLLHDDNTVYNAVIKVYSLLVGINGLRDLMQDTVKNDIYQDTV